MLKELKDDGRNASPAVSIARFNSLTEFYECLSELGVKVEQLRAQGHTQAAVCAAALLTVIERSADDFLKSSDITAFDTFKRQCQAHIQSAKPTLEMHRGWEKTLKDLMIKVVGVWFYNLVGSFANAVSFGCVSSLFKTRTMDQANKVNGAVSLCSERLDPVDQRPMDLKNI